MPTAVSNGERLTPNDSQYDVVSFNVLVDGKAIEVDFEVLSVTVTLEANRIPAARIVLRDGDVASETFAASEGDLFTPGKKVEVKVGRDGHNNSVFKGIIVGQSLRARQGGDPSLTLECKDETVKLTIGRKNRYFENVKDQEAISTVLSGMAGEVADTSATHKEIVQFHSTDWDFIRSRADRNGLLAFVEAGKVHLKKPDTTDANPSVVNLVFGSNLIEFESELEARGQWASVEAKAWDYSQQAFFEVESSTSDKYTDHGSSSGSDLAAVIGLDKLPLRHSGQVRTDELQAWADATMLRSRLSKIRGRAKIIGFADVAPSKCVVLRGLGARFNGKAYVTGVRHEVGAGTWFTHVQFGLSPEWLQQQAADVMEAPASGLLPAVHGLQIGIVVQLQNDPDGEDRILVKLPIVDNAAQGIWTRIATLDAGNQRGSFFRPEIGDEVIVGFINDDPRDAVILGMLNSSAKPAPLTAADENHIKGLVTRSQMKVLFDDDQKVITMETPAGNKVVISEADKSITTTDQNGNSSKMSPSGIEVKSPGDIKVEASGNISIKATGNLSLEGMNVSVKANAALSAEGQASAKLNSSGITEVKGSMLMLN